jgi:outer membrane protein TolC
MKKIILLVFLFSGNRIIAQSLGNMSDSVKVESNKLSKTSKSISSTLYSTLKDDEAIKEKLISLALANPGIAIAISNINNAEIAKRKAKTSILSAVNLGGNLNEFVISNPQAAAFFPKYNFGLNLPLDLFARNKAAKKTAQEMLLIAKAQKEELENNLRTRVLVQYEIYKQEKTLLQLKKISLEDASGNYEKAQKDFQNETITLDDLNKIYKIALSEKEQLVSKEKDFNIAVIMLEDLVGVKLKTIIEN